MHKGIKKKVLFFIGLLCLISILLAVSLPILTLQPGLPLPELQSGKIIAKSMQGGDSLAIQIDSFFFIVIALMMVGLLGYLATKLIRGVTWDQLRKIALNLFVTFITVSIIILFAVFLLQKGKSTQSPIVVKMTPTPQMTSPLGQVPPILLWIVGILLIGSIMVITGRLLLSNRQKQKGAIIRVKLEAEKAYQAILSGQNIKDVIIQCYRQMSIALAEENGIERQEFLTPREFEDVLTQAGFPKNPLEKLTSMFEAVRYGNWSPAPGDEKMAIQCFEEIYQAAAKLREKPA